MTEQKESLAIRFRETSERLVALEKERELAGGQFIPSDRDYCYSTAVSNDSSIEASIEEAREDERRKMNGILFYTKNMADIKLISTMPLFFPLSTIIQGVSIRVLKVILTKSIINHKE